MYNFGYNWSMEREGRKMTSEEEVSRILGLPLEQIEFLKEEHGMPVTDPEFSEWFVTNPDIVLAELKRNFEQLLFPGEFRPEFAEPAS